MSVEVSASAHYSAVGDAQQLTASAIDGLRDVAVCWGYPYDVVTDPVDTTGIAHLAAPVVKQITSGEQVRTLILATLAPDWLPDSQPAVDLLTDVGHPDPAKVSCWSLTENGLIGPLLAIRLAQLRMSRTGGDALVVAADRTELPYAAPELPCHRRATADQASGVRLSHTDTEGLAYTEHTRLVGLWDTVSAQAAEADRVVVGPELGDHADSVDGAVTVVTPGTPASGLLAEMARSPGRVVCATWDPELQRGACLSIGVREPGF